MTIYTIQFDASDDDVPQFCWTDASASILLIEELTGTRAEAEAYAAEMVATLQADSDAENDGHWTVTASIKEVAA